MDDLSFGGFVRHYWSAFMWIGIAILGLVIGVIVLTSPEPNSSATTILGGFVCLAFIRGLMRGVRPSTQGVGGDDGCIVLLFSLVFIVILYPLAETFIQGRFLLRAWKMWRQGEILVKEKNGKPVRSAY